MALFRWQRRRAEALQIGIASPCVEQPWDSMRGDDRTRFCQRCSLHVFNVSELSELEIRELMAKKGGLVCGRLFRRKDGTVLTRDCPTGLRALRLRFFRGVAAAATLLTGLVGYRAATREVSCTTPTEAEPSAFARVEVAVQDRYVELRETLRDTKTFGPLIDHLSPRRSFIMGRITAVRENQAAEETSD